MGSCAWTWCVSVHSRRLAYITLIVCCFIERLESRMNPKLLNLPENAMLWTPTAIGDGEQLEGVESGGKKSTAFVLFIIKFSWLLHIHDLMSSVPVCRSRVRVCISLDGVDFWSSVSSSKSWWLIECFAMMSESVHNKQYMTQHRALWDSEHQWRRRSRIVYENELIYVQQIWSKPLQCTSVDAKDGFETRK